MRTAFAWGALFALGVSLPVASCGDSTQNSSIGDGGDSLGGTAVQAGSSQSDSGGQGAEQAIGDGGAGAGGVSGKGGDVAAAGLGGGRATGAGGGNDGGTASLGIAGEAIGGIGGEGGRSEPNLPLQCTNGQKDAGEVCVDCGGPCPACELVWKCSDAACDGAPSACVGSGLCPGGPKPADCLHGTGCESLNTLPAVYVFGVPNGCSPSQDECRGYECKCGCPD
jgi:hypothetical protein